MTTGPHSTEYQIPDITLGDTFNEWRTTTNDGIIDNENTDDWHHLCFNQDYFIIGYYQAEQWLIDDGRNYTFEVLGYVLEQEKEIFGEIQTIFDNAETLVNHYAYWLGYEVVQAYIDTIEE